MFSGKHALILPTLLALGFLGCGGGKDAVDPSTQGLSAQAQLGELIFKDTSLSASGLQSCATCHDKAFAHGSPNALPAQLGGPNMDVQGNRLSPTIRYLAVNKPFRFDKDGTPTGGFFWDGRAGSLAEQAAGPFLNPREMAMPDKASVVARLAAAPYAADFKRAFGADIFSDVERAYLCMTLAIQRYELEDADFHPFDSKYDAFLAGKAEFSAQEKRGLALFNSPTKGNCAACHPSAKGADGAPPMFTDFTYDVLGVPRNPELKDNADPSYYDLGLAARAAGDLADRKELYGAFKVPTLRNVAIRKAYFHNGYFKTLKEAIAFYVQRDTNPEKFYPRNPDGTVHKFNDLPAAYHANVNVTEVPYNRQPGDSPALTDEEIDDLIAFLNTLTDGYRP
ncbi:cytochrome-c peroxidase [Geothrix sp. PMB-07]|uniref:cytochrome-c peroxidase n=1 Tax=Geothrix sp. PMB-07 TaxID=3068640 RepID=UPI0027426E51|nr:cytochrome c peroxidase [Geothrix sp. PMB-07]WLT30975.1 cytochrome c peroxidase [Geothrix sp. PMB-07]